MRAQAFNHGQSKEGAVAPRLGYFVAGVPGALGAARAAPSLMIIPLFHLVGRKMEHRGPSVAAHAMRRKTRLIRFAERRFYQASRVRLTKLKITMKDGVAVQGNFDKLPHGAAGGEAQYHCPSRPSGGNVCGRAGAAVRQRNPGTRGLVCHPLAREQREFA
jgi:hypothetical protein